MYICIEAAVLVTDYQSIKEMAEMSTEEKIKAAARTVFYKKGFAGTRTRDIAEEANINLALLNYYFRSKAKLFEIIMLETFSSFMENIQKVLDDEASTLEEKINEIANQYIDLIIKEPEIPTFLLTEIRSNPKELKNKFTIGKKIFKSVFHQQYMQAYQEGKVTEAHPLHFMLNLIGLIVFPFIAKPLLLEISGVEVGEFNRVMKERKALIPKWVKAMMTVS